MPEISLVVPVFDEEDNLRDLHQAITDALTGMSYEVLYVNDGSVDRSASRSFVDRRVSYLFLLISPNI